MEFLILKFLLGVSSQLLLYIVGNLFLHKSSHSRQILLFEWNRDFTFIYFLIVLTPSIAPLIEQTNISLILLLEIKVMRVKDEFLFRTYSRLCVNKRT